MLAPETVYIVVLSDSGSVLASRYIESSRIGTWLRGMEAATCLVYDSAPLKGGALLRTLTPDRPSNRWVEVAKCAV